MRLFHTTTEFVLPSILHSGLLLECAETVVPAIWLHSEERNLYALECVRRRHQLHGRGLALVVVDVPRSWITRWSRGLWRCWADVPLSRIKSWECI